MAAAIKSEFDRRGHHPKMRLPGPALAGLYLSFCLLPLLLASWRNVAAFDLWEGVAAALGLVGLAAMAVQFVTSGRFETISGKLGIDKIMAFHKIAAVWVLLALVLHPFLFVVPTVLQDPALGTERLIAYFTLPHYRSGVIALAALMMIVVTSVMRDRLPWRYEIWRASHVLLGGVALGGGLHHAVTTGRFSASGMPHWFWWMTGIGVLVVLAVLYGWRWLMLHRRPWRLASVTRVADRIWELDIQPSFRNGVWSYEAGQFVWMTEGRRRFPLFDHPFSIADSPTRPGLSLIIKEAGDFTGTVGSLPPGTPIGVDGPYGEFTLQAHGGDNVVLIAGGAGIGPIMGLLRDMVARHDPRPVRLAYAAGGPENFACLDEIEAATGLLDLEVVLLSETQGEGWQGEVGRLDHDRLRILLDGLDPKVTTAFMCGPGPMVTAVSDALLDVGLSMKSVIYERFDYGGGASSRQDRRRTRSLVLLGCMLAASTVGFALMALH